LKPSSNASPSQPATTHEKEEETADVDELARGLDAMKLAAVPGNVRFGRGGQGGFNPSISGRAAVRGRGRSRGRGRARGKARGGKTAGEHPSAAKGDEGDDSDEEDMDVEDEKAKEIISVTHFVPLAITRKMKRDGMSV
jgi:hypothetical protein